MAFPQAGVSGMPPAMYYSEVAAGVPDARFVDVGANMPMVVTPDGLALPHQLPHSRHGHGRQNDASQEVYNAMAYGIPAQCAPQQHGDTLTLPLTMSVQGGSLQFSGGWSLQMQGRVLRQDIDAVITALNEVARKEGPSMGVAATVPRMIPFIGLGAIVYANLRYNAMNKALMAKCEELNKEYNSKNINVRFVSAGSPQRNSAMTVISLEVA
mmetsp:Transcript_6464/g.20120  ORF Transcript_6464/g.20120 Transcript_6464/m.20120 type:complete len:212 (-) Transcript_6464:371-1006(-)